MLIKIVHELGSYKQNKPPTKDFIIALRANIYETSSLEQIFESMFAYHVTNHVLFFVLLCVSYSFRSEKIHFTNVPFTTFKYCSYATLKSWHLSSIIVCKFLRLSKARRSEMGNLTYYSDIESFEQTFWINLICILVWDRISLNRNRNILDLCF